MQEIPVYDFDGNTLTDLVQFDKDVYIHIIDSRIRSNYQIHFFNSASELAFVVDSTYDDGILCVKIPNDLLVLPYSITGYVNVAAEDGSKCLYGFKIAVRKKPQPSDWVYVESNDYIALKQIIQECKDYADNAEISCINTIAYKDEAFLYANDAKASENNAKASSTTAILCSNNAYISEQNAKASELAAKNSENNSISCETASLDNSKKAESYAVGTMGNYRVNDDIDNAKYYYEQTKMISLGLSGALLPMGTIKFEQLKTQSKETGYMFNVSNDFITDDSFKEGSGIPFPAGTNVYYTYDGYWDCLAGIQVIGIKGDKENNYRNGYINLTCENIGALEYENTITNDEIQSLFNN